MREKFKRYYNTVNVDINPPDETSCNRFTIITKSNESIVFNITRCAGDVTSPTSITLPGLTTMTGICAKRVTTDADPGKGVVMIELYPCS